MQAVCKRVSGVHVALPSSGSRITSGAMFAAFVNLVPTEQGRPGIGLHRPLVACLQTAWLNDAEQADKTCSRLIHQRWAQTPDSQQSTG